MTMTRILTIFSVAALLTSCGTIDKMLPDKKADYKQSRSAPSLEVPPDLNVSKTDDSMALPDAGGEGAATFSGYSQQGEAAQAAGGNAVLPPQDNIHVERDGDKRWLVIHGGRAAVWDKMREFWLENGFLVKREDPKIGILETDWAENRADIPLDPVRNLVSKALDSLYSAPTRDMYRVRLEPGAEAGTTELYLTHRGVQEVVTANSTVWQARPADPELEAEMLSRLMTFMGVEKQQARQTVSSAEPAQARATLTRNADGSAALDVDEEVTRAWRRTGLALDRIGFTVEDRDRSKGLYFVRYNDPLAEQNKKGLLSKLAFWSDDEDNANGGDKYQISVQGQGTGTRITVLDKNGAPVTKETGARILTLLQEQMK